jgi:hypothetical protein
LLFANWIPFQQEEQMGRSRIWAAGLAVMVTFGFPAPVSAGGETFVIANTATNLGEPVPRGALLSVFTEAPVSPEDADFNPWVADGPGGLRVMASCTAHTFTNLPIVAVKTSGTGHRIDVYYPNGMGEEPFGDCDNEGTGEVWVIPAEGFGQMMEQPVITVNGHPGIFSVGIYPDGEHVNGNDSKTTSLVECSRDPVFCPVRTLNKPAKLVVRLTGSEFFVCKPCPQNTIKFDLAPVTNGTVGTYQQQTLLSLMPVSMGVEEAQFELNSNLTGGEYRLRVRVPVQPNMPDPLTVLLGPPN